MFYEFLLAMPMRSSCGECGSDKVGRDTTGAKYCKDCGVIYEE